MKKCLCYSVLMLAVFTLIGCVLGALSDLVIEPKRTAVNFYEILFHNGQLSLGILLGGLLTFSVLSIIILFLNAATAGFLVVKLINNVLISHYMDIFIPHAALELLAYTIFLSVSLYVTKGIIFSLQHKKRYRKWVSPPINFKVWGIAFLSGWIVLFLAAMVETFAY